MGVYDVAVIGIGGMGSAAAYHLARRGLSVLGIEQFDIPHEMGSSHGVSRIIRLAYAEGHYYVPLLQRAYESWRELENRSGERLLIVTGGIDAGAPGSKTIKGVLASCARYALPHELLDARAVRRRFPAYRLRKEMVAVYQPESGFLLPERCIVAYVRAAQDSGADIRARERVVEWSERRGQVTVITDRGTYHARKLVITAGPWASQLVPALRRVAVPQRQVLIWTQPLRHPEWFALGALPIVNMEAAEGRFYAFPVYSVPGFKIGKYYHRHQRIDPSDMDRSCTIDDERVLRAGIRRYFPDANGPTMAMKTCIFTNTPDRNFIIDVHPKHRGVAIAAGFSGHGFKFCSVVGEILSDIVTRGKTRFDISKFSLARPQIARELPTVAEIRRLAK